MNRMMEAYEVKDEFWAQAEAMGVPKEGCYAWVAGAMAAEIVILRERLAMSQRAYQESIGAL